MNTKLDQRKCKKAFVAQQDKTDCGAACLLSLIYFYGGGGHLEKLRGNAGNEHRWDDPVGSTPSC